MNNRRGLPDPISPILPVRQKSRALPWLLSLLGFTGVAGLGAHTLDDRQKNEVELKKLHEEKADLEREVERAKKELADAKNAGAKQAQTNKETSRLLAELRARVNDQDGDILGDDNHITVSLVDQILFKSGDATLSPRGQKLLSKIGEVLKTLEDKQIVIGGHTDNRPIHTAQFPSNWELSSARAVTVVHHLIDVAGVDPHKLSTAGYAEFHPRSTKHRAKNRRIEILLTPEIKEVKVDKTEIAKKEAAPAKSTPDATKPANAGPEVAKKDSGKPATSETAKPAKAAKPAPTLASASRRR